MQVKLIYLNNILVVDNNQFITILQYCHNIINTSNLILILKAFYKRKLINRSQCEILLQKIKALQQVQNIEDVLKQASLPAQQENKQSQSEKKKAKKLQNQMDISIDD
ncbi:Hypothetical_protein [Hexamita inflata]|uniref:Hypothetical_protein n=1 Tax=Hexamita inflata TaxID=28002 RepID=A0AA86S166_9EUKA|nr:Hypothetical protein HINF_LOCUS63910 [Hexamita inflata]